MTLNEFEKEIAEIKRQHPNAGDMELGPVFWQGGNNVLMMIDKLTVESKTGWDGKDAIGIHWNC